MRHSLRELAHGRDAVAHCPELDKYGRYVGRLVIDGADVGLLQIERGIVWHFKRNEAEQRPEDCRAYADAEWNPKTRLGSTARETTRLCSVR